MLYPGCHCVQAKLQNGLRHIDTAANTALDFSSHHPITIPKKVNACDNLFVAHMHCKPFGPHGMHFSGQPWLHALLCSKSPNLVEQQHVMTLSNRPKVMKGPFRWLKVDLIVVSS